MFSPGSPWFVKLSGLVFYTEKASQNEMLKFCLKCIKMGIPSLNSIPILYQLFSLHFIIKVLRRRSGWHLNHANITNIPDLVQENGPFCGQKAHFDVRIHKTRHFHGRHAHFSVTVQENAPFCGRDRTIQSGHISGHKLNALITRGWNNPIIRNVESPTRSPVKFIV